MVAKVRPSHIICLTAGGGAGTAVGGLLSTNLDLAQVETRTGLVLLFGLACYGLLGSYFERRVAARVATARTEGFVDGYSRGQIDRLDPAGADPRRARRG